MAQVSDWQTEEAKNTSLDELTLSGEGGLYTNKIMCAVKKKFDEVDSKLDAVAGGLVFRGTKATYADLEAVEDPAVGDMYSVTALGGENYAWDGEAWDALGTSDANVVHKTGNELIAGNKSFTGLIDFTSTTTNNVVVIKSAGSTKYVDLRFAVDETQGNYNAICRLNATSGDSATGTLYIARKVAGYTSIFLAPSLELEPSGSAYLSACDGANAPKRLAVGVDGSLTWDGQPLQTTSDARLKTPLSAVPDDVLDAWGDVGWGQFQYLDAVARKGEDSARLHLGLVAQTVKAAFDARGLDACAYGILCHDEHAAAPAVYGDDGELLSPARVASDVWTIRYAEAQAMEAAYQRRRADRLEARIAVLEARLNGIN